MEYLNISNFSTNHDESPFSYSWNSLEYGRFVAFPIFGQTHILDEVVIEMSKRMISLSRRPLCLPQDVIACWLTAPSKGTTATW